MACVGTTDFNDCAAYQNYANCFVNKPCLCVQCIAGQIWAQRIWDSVDLLNALGVPCNVSFSCPKLPPAPPPPLTPPRGGVGDCAPLQAGNTVPNSGTFTFSDGTVVDVDSGQSAPVAGIFCAGCSTVPAGATSPAAGTLSLQDGTIIHVNVGDTTSAPGVFCAGCFPVPQGATASDDGSLTYDLLNGHGPQIDAVFAGQVTDYAGIFCPNGSG